MIGNSITLDPGSGPVDLALINEGGYSSEYLFRDATVDTRINIRHSKEKASGTQVQMDRHNVTVTQTFAPTTPFPEGHSVQASITLRIPPTESIAVLSDLLTGLVTWMADGTPTINQDRVLNWES